MKRSEPDIVFAAEDLIKSLDWTEWMGNKIRVRFSMVRRSRDFTMGLEKTVEEKLLSDVESFKPEDMIVLDEVTGSPSRYQKCSLLSPFLFRLVVFIFGI